MLSWYSTSQTRSWILARKHFVTFKAIPLLPSLAVLEVVAMAVRRRPDWQARGFSLSPFSRWLLLAARLPKSGGLDSTTRIAYRLIKSTLFCRWFFVFVFKHQKAPQSLGKQKWGNYVRYIQILQYIPFKPAGSCTSWNSKIPQWGEFDLVLLWYFETKWIIRKNGIPGYPNSWLLDRRYS